MARPVVRLPVVIVETAPAMLATRRASIAVASTTPAATLSCTISTLAVMLVYVTKSLAAATVVLSEAIVIFLVASASISTIGNTSTAAESAADSSVRSVIFTLAMYISCRDRL